MYITSNPASLVFRFTGRCTARRNTDRPAGRVAVLGVQQLMCFTVTAAATTAVNKETTPRFNLENALRLSFFSCV